MAPNDTEGRLYVVATSHLDTQWRWTVRDTIERFLPATLEQSFRRFEKFPFFVLSFEGAFRYRLIHEYYPDAFARLVDHAAAGRWHPAGGMVDAPDVNIVSPESLIRQILYGNRFFERRLGIRSRDVFLPDCFGFSWALPSIARHCGLIGFSSQKLVKWTAPGGIPFDVGQWEGPDGSRIVAALRPGGYGDKLAEPPSRSAPWIERVHRFAARTGVAIGYRYFGVGDRGGAPDEASIARLGDSLADPDGLRVIHGGSDRLFTDLTAEEIERLPVHAGELLLPTHGTGCWTSQLRMKRWNRRCESLADAAERAAALAAWLGAMPYPAAELRRSWERFLWHQMHDDLTGTSIPGAYRLSWNDQLLALKSFSTLLTDAVAAAARGLSTAGAGEPLVVFNPLARRRRDAVRARVRFADPPPAAIRVLGPDGEVPSQITAAGDRHLDLVFLAAAAPVSLTVYRVEPALEAALTPPASVDGPRAEVRAGNGRLENRRYVVSVSPRGEVRSIYDKRLARELLAGAVELQLLADHSRRWPAWELLHRDVARRPRRLRPRLGGGRGVRVEVAESGPARAALRIEQSLAGGSTLVQHLRLHAGDGEAADRLEWELEIDWRTWRRMLKIAFPLAAASDRAAYDLGLGAIERGVNTPTSYEVPAQRWASQSAGPEAGEAGSGSGRTVGANGADGADGRWGTTLFTDGGYGWDKPDAATLRHTLVRSPMARHHFRHQSHQDFGAHRVRLALVAHAGDWAAGEAPAHAAALHQPLVAFQTRPHRGPLGNEVALLDLRGEGAEVRALKRLEDPETRSKAPQEWVLRLAEQHGGRATVSLALGRGVAAAREIDGCEKPLARLAGAGHRLARLAGGRLEVDLGRFQTRAFALELEPPRTPLAALESHPLELSFDRVATSFHHRPAAVDFDGRGNSLPGELLPAELTSGEVSFHLGPVEPGAANAMVCRGQRLSLPPAADVVFLLATAVGASDERIEIEAGGVASEIVVHPYSGFVGQGSRWPQYRGWRIGDERPAFLRPAPVAWTGTHRHGPGATDQAYVFCYLYRYEIALAEGATELRLPRAESVRIFAATAARRGPTALHPATELIPG